LGTRKTLSNPAYFPIYENEISLAKYIEEFLDVFVKESF